MGIQENRFKALLLAYRQNNLSKEEFNEFFDMVRDTDNADLVRNWLGEPLTDNLPESATGADKVDWDKLFNRVIATDEPKTTASSLFSRRSWFRYAALVLLVLGVSVFLLSGHFQKDEEVVLTEQKEVVDRAPGGNRAVLILGDGSEIVLDSADDGELALQRGVSVLKTADGRLEYQDMQQPGSLGDAVMYNTMRTPNGGQYQLILPDRTKVWLNAASSITYPVVFSETERAVVIEGEVYFEVAKKNFTPFIVDMHDTRIEVLGTRFNVNGYGDEVPIATTLLEGSVRVHAEDKSQILKPRQQAQVTGVGEIKLINNIDVAQTTAWKDGTFSFPNTSLEVAMKQLSRWYDVEVIYDKKIPGVQFRGEMGRDLTLSQVLRGLSGMGVKFSMDEKNRLIVTAEEPAKQM